MRYATLLLIVLAAACAPATGPSAGGAAQTNDTPRDGGVFAYAGQTMGQSLNPHRFASSPERYAPGPVFESLLTYKGGINDDFKIDFAVEPWLAERWEQPNENTYVFTMRQGVRWHDG